MLSWLEDRIRIKSSIREFLDYPLPHKVGWPHVLGSTLLGLFAIQFLTGVLLSFLYAPSPLSAYESVRYITYELRGGDWLRAIHYWGSSFIIVILGLHLIRTFVYAAYRKPREITWIVGVCLLLCGLAFGQTGYLLTWDQKAYWGTQVTIQIIQTAPFLGNFLASLIRGGPQVGALTLSRFFAIHAIILPLITILLISIHLLLIRKFGITAPASPNGLQPVKTFYPYQMAKDAFAMFVVLLLVLALAALIDAPLGRPVDPTDTTFVPRPDWYFLFLFQSLRYFQGKAEIIGTFILPTLGVLLLFLYPFIDKNPNPSLLRRPISLLLLIAAVGGWFYLTYSALATTEHPSRELTPQGIVPSRNQRIKRPAEVGGMYVLKQRCFACHSLSPLGERRDLQTLSRNHFPEGAEWLNQHLSSQGSTANLQSKEVSEILSVLRLLARDETTSLSSIPATVRFGGHFFFNKACTNCHTIDGQGGKKSEIKGPDLTIRPLRTKSWHIQHIRDPQTVAPNSKMPPFFHYEDYEYAALADYLLYLHTP